GAARAHHIGDGVGHPELDGDLHGAVEADDLGLDAAFAQVGAHQVGVGGGDALACQILDRPFGARGGGVAEAGTAEAEGEALLDRGAGVQRQVAAGDAEVELAGADVDGDVLGPQEVELDLVLRVEDAQLAGIGALAVAGLGEDGGGRFRQRAFVGDCYAQHGEDCPSEGWRYRAENASVTDVGTRRRASAPGPPSAPGPSTAAARSPRPGTRRSRVPRRARPRLPPRGPSYPGYARRRPGRPRCRTPRDG